MSEVGYGKPPKHTRFGEPNGNLPGRTSEQRKLEIANAERATRIRGRFLEALEGLMLEHPEKETLIEERLTSEVLRLLKESEDRGLGTARQSVDMTSSDGSMSPKPLDLSKLPSEALEAIVKAADGQSDNG
jgi:hypothetical protein